MTRVAWALAALTADDAEISEGEMASKIEPRSARQQFATALAKQRCAHDGFALDFPACQLLIFKPDDLRPLWQAYYLPLIERELAAEEASLRLPGFAGARVS